MRTVVIAGALALGASSAAVLRTPSPPPPVRAEPSPDPRTIDRIDSGLKPPPPGEKVETRTEPDDRPDVPAAAPALPDLDDPSLPPEHPAGRWILVHKQNRAAYLMSGRSEEARFPCAVGRGAGAGRADHTPTGWHRITTITRGPTWYPSRRIRKEYGLPPWGVIAAGDARNALGTVWMALNGSSIGLHGTNDPSRIGRAVTHGCVAFLNADIEQLAHAVKVGTKVLVVESGQP